MDVAWKMSKIFPLNTVAVRRAFYWLNDRDPIQARLFARSVYYGIFGEGHDLSKPEVVADIAASLFVDKDELLVALQEQEVKDKLREEIDKAIEKGVFSFFLLLIEKGFGAQTVCGWQKKLQSGDW